MGTLALFVGIPITWPLTHGAPQTLALAYEWKHSFTEHKRKPAWSIIDLRSGESFALDKINEGTLIWLGTDDNSLLWTTTAKTGITRLSVIPNFRRLEHILIGNVDGHVGATRSVAVDGGANLVFISRTNPNGTIFNDKKPKPPQASGMVFESLYFRHWDKVITEQPHTLFSLRLRREGDRIKMSEPLNLLPVGSGLESPVPPFGGVNDFDISPDGSRVVFVAKTPHLNPANNTQTLVYEVPHNASVPPQPINYPEGYSVDGYLLPQGASCSPKYSPDGRSIAYLQMYENGYESDTNKIFIYSSVDGSIYPIAKSWDVSPGRLRWASDGQSILSTADHWGKLKLFQINLKNSRVSMVWGWTSVGGYRSLPGGNILISLSSLVSSPRTFLLDPRTGSLQALQQKPEAEKSLHATEVEEFNYPGAGGVPIHGFIVKPSYYDKTAISKYKMALFIHGGPQG